MRNVRCLNSPKKKRVSVTHKGNPGDYKRGMRGHSYKKTFYGRFCTRCNKKWFKPFQAELVKKEGGFSGQKKEK